MYKVVQFQNTHSMEKVIEVPSKKIHIKYTTYMYIKLNNFKIPYLCVPGLNICFFFFSMFLFFVYII
jgi:hypothetical protein